MYNGEEHYFHHQLSWESVGGRDLRNDTDGDYEDETYSTYLYGNETLRVLDQYAAQKKKAPDADKPFFLFLSYQAIHSPLQAPEDVIDIFQHRIVNESRRTLAAMATVVDWSIGEIIDYLKSAESNKLWEDTLVIVSTDNGGPVDNGGNNFPLRLVSIVFMNCFSPYFVFLFFHKQRVEGYIVGGRCQRGRLCDWRIPSH